MQLCMVCTSIMRGLNLELTLLTPSLNLASRMVPSRVPCSSMAAIAPPPELKKLLSSKSDEKEL